MDKISKKGQKTRQSILDAAFELFHEHGIHATSVDDILKASGTGKSQFYYYFKNKEAVIHALLQDACHLIKSGQTHFQPINTWEEFRKLLDAVIAEYGEHQCSRACPIGQMGAQIAKDDDLLRQDIKLIFEAMKEYLKIFFVQLKAQDQLVEMADPDAMANMCISAMQGAGLLAKVNQNDAVIRSIADQLYQYMRSFLK